MHHWGEFSGSYLEEGASGQAEGIATAKALRPKVFRNSKKARELGAE